MTLQSKGRVGAIERSIVGGRLRGVKRCVRTTAGVPFMCTAHVVLLMIRSILAGSHRPVSTGCLLTSLIGSSGQVLLWFGVVAIRFVEIYSKCLQYYIILSVISVFVFFLEVVFVARIQISSKSGCPDMTSIMIPVINVESDPPVVL